MKDEGGRMKLAPWLRRLLRLAPPPEAAHLQLGIRGEAAAARFLRRAGLRVIARNLQTPGGEADIVCVDRKARALVLVEVKTRIREGERDGAPPTVAIHADKRRRLVATVLALSRTGRFEGLRPRIDVVTVEYRDAQDREPLILHYPDAVTGEARLR